MLTDGCTDARTDDGQKVITIAHPEQSSGELKICEKIRKISIFVFENISALFQGLIQMHTYMHVIWAFNFTA